MNKEKYQTKKFSFLRRTILCKIIRCNNMTHGHDCASLMARRCTYQLWRISFPLDCQLTVHLFLTAH